MSGTGQLTIITEFGSCIESPNCSEISNPDDFTMNVINNGSPISSFDGSTTGVTIMLAAGTFEVTELFTDTQTPISGSPNSVCTNNFNSIDFQAGITQESLAVCADFMGDCSGTIMDGDQLTCTIENSGTGVRVIPPPGPI